MVSAHSPSACLHCLFSSSSLSAGLMHLQSPLLLSSIFLLFILFQQQKHVYAAAAAACMCVHVCARAVSEEKVFAAVMAKHGCLSLSLFLSLSLVLNVWKFNHDQHLILYLRVFMCSCTCEASAYVDWGRSAVIRSRHWGALQSRSPFSEKLTLSFFGLQLENYNQYLHVMDTVFVSFVLFCTGFCLFGAVRLVILWV